MWRKALIVAAAVELPLVVAFACIGRHPNSAMMARRILVYYHIVSLGVIGFFWLWIDGLISDGTWAKQVWGFAYWVMFYAGQVAITTPIVFYILKFCSRRSDSIEKQ